MEVRGVLLAGAVTGHGELHVLVRPKRDEGRATAVSAPGRGPPAPVNVHAFGTSRRRKREADRLGDRIERLVIGVPASRRPAVNGVERGLGPDVLASQDRIGDVYLDASVEVDLDELDLVVILEGGGNVRSQRAVAEEETLGDVDRNQY